MPIEVGIWRLDAKPTRIHFSRMEREDRLEQILAEDISIADPNLLLIGRQVPTAFGKYIDLLALDADGNLVVLELKRDQTPREVVAQLLDYGSWVRLLEYERIACIFDKYLEKYHPNQARVSLEQAFCDRFKVSGMPDALNESHKLVVVASELDDSTERIIGYLWDEYSVAINAVFFRFFRDGNAEYLSRAWLNDPGYVEAKPRTQRAPRAPGQATNLFGHSICSVMHYLGKNGWDFAKAKRAVTTLADTSNIKESSLRTYWSDGRNPTYSKPAELTAEQAQKLEEAAKQSASPEASQ